MREKLTRVGDLVRLLVRHGGSGILSTGGSDEFLTDAETTGGTADGPEKLAADLEAMGPTYIKLGQLLSTRHDLLPEAYTEALSRLQDDVDPIDADEVRDLIAEVNTLKTLTNCHLAYGTLICPNMDQL